MVKNFTKDESLVCQSVTVVQEVTSEEQFEADLKANLQQFVREPSKKILDNILNYSRSLRKL